MPRLIAFLRAINVGGHTVTMAQLRKEFEALGFEDVETFIASGNIIFSARSAEPAALEKKIEAQAARSLGYEVATFVRTLSEVAAVAALPAISGGADRSAGAFCVGFLSAPLDAATTRALMAFTTDIDDFHTHGREVYWLCKKRQSESTFSNTQHGAGAENPRHVPRPQHSDTAGREARSVMIKTRTLDSTTILELDGPLTAGQTDAALRKAVRLAFESGARTVILNMQHVPSIDSSGVAALASGHMTAANRGGHLKLCELTAEAEGRLRHHAAGCRVRVVRHGSGGDCQRERAADVSADVVQPVRPAVAARRSTRRRRTRAS